jgi:hypothetical protein
MKQKLSLVLVITLVVGLAGCVGGTGDVNGGDGSDGSGSGDVTLVDNRTAVLANAGGYTTTWQMNVSSENEGLSVVRYANEVDYESERSRFEMLMTDRDEVTNDYESFYADGTLYTRIGEGEDATYTRADGEFAPENSLFSVQSYITSESDLERFSVAGTETYDGISVTRYERTEQPNWIAPQEAGTEFSWTEFNYVVLVDADGLVRYESWGGDGVDEAGVEHAMTFSYSLTDMGSTVVEDPNWLTVAGK